MAAEVRDVTDDARDVREMMIIKHLKRWTSDEVKQRMRGREL